MSRREAKCFAAKRRRGKANQAQMRAGASLTLGGHRMAGEGLLCWHLSREGGRAPSPFHQCPHPLTHCCAVSPSPCQELDASALEVLKELATSANPRGQSAGSGGAKSCDEGERPTLITSLSPPPLPFFPWKPLPCLLSVRRCLPPLTVNGPPWARPHLSSQGKQTLSPLLPRPSPPHLRMPPVFKGFHASKHPTLITSVEILSPPPFSAL